MAQELVFFVTEHENGGKTSTDKILTKKKFGKPNERNWTNLNYNLIWY